MAVGRQLSNGQNVVHPPSGLAEAVGCSGIAAIVVPIRGVGPDADDHPACRGSKLRPSRRTGRNIEGHHSTLRESPLADLLL